MRKIIGITSSSLLGRNPMAVIDVDYEASVRLAGGLPLIIPPSDDLSLASRYIDVIDGLLLTGGVDVSPFLYGEDPLAECQIPDDTRDAFELELLKEALERKMEVLGVCRGAQLINVALGGTLIQHLALQKPYALEHTKPEIRASYHTIDTREGSRAAVYFGETIIVNSIHHQAIGEVAEGLTVTASSDDGIVEALEAEHLFATQFHPERLHTDEIFLEVFRDFIRRIL